MDDESLSRIIEMAWEDRTPFDAIKAQFGISESEVIKIMRKILNQALFDCGEKRVTGRKTKHGIKREFDKGRFKSKNQK